MRAVFNPTYQNDKKELLSFVENFTTSGESFGNGDRNRIKLFDFKARKINIKAFKTPNLINQFAYKYIRHSKAERSFEYANKLTDLGIGTPEPIAYIENYGGLGLKDSYYISFHDEPKYTYRDLVHHFDLPHYDKILRAFTKFSFQLHEKGVEFLDHSPGNTLIFENENSYNFKLVDLNRMNFRLLSFDDRMRNMRRLTPHKEMIEVMSDEYAKLSHRNFEEVFEKMWFYTVEFQAKFHRKQRIKKKIKFWKK